MKIFSIIAGIVMIISGIYGMLHPFMTFLEMTWLLGGVLIFSGLFGIVGYFGKRKPEGFTIWNLVSELLTVCLGIFVLTKPGISDVFIAYLFGGWLIMSGILKSIGAWSIKKAGTKNWICLFILGILDVFIGFYAAFHPFVSLFTIGMIVGITFCTYGINLTVFGIQLKKE